MIWKLPIKGQWVEISSDQLKWMHRNGRGEHADKLMSAIEGYEKNRLAYYLPHGVPWRDRDVVAGDGAVTYLKSEYPREWRNDGVAFLSDWKNSIVMNVSPNQVGKTTDAVIKTALHILPTDADWPIFKEHGVVRHEWPGPVTWVMASYSWDNVKTLWERIKHFFPREQLGEYSPNWGKFEGEKGKPRDLAFGDKGTKDLKLKCGSVIKFLCYTQLQAHWESFSSSGLTADEQIPYEKFIGWSRSTITTGDYTPCFMALTGHVLPDRPDTGMAGWIYLDLWTGRNTHGRTIGRYQKSVSSTPNAIIGSVKKKELYLQFVDPEIKRSDKLKRAAAARYWGGWENGSGMVFDEFERRFHVINPLWEDNKTPQGWTKWRVIDFGDNGISCCLWFAVSPSNTAFCYRCLYESGLGIAQLARQIIERSHNKQVPSGELVDEASGAVYTLYIEKMVGEQYYSSIIDSRSAAQQKMGATLINIFQRYGLELSTASGQRDNIQIPRLKEWLSLDMGKEHISRKDEAGFPEMGAPRMYFFDGRTEPAVREFESLALDPNDPSKIKLHQANHTIDAAKYFCSDNPVYYGDIELHQADEESTAEYSVDKMTGY